MELWWLVSALVGWGLASWVIVLLTLPDPPPDAFMKYVVICVAGIIGALVGASLTRGASDPMPGLIGSLAGASILVGIARAFASGARR